MRGMKREMIRVCHVADWCSRSLDPWCDRVVHGGPLTDDEVHQLRVTTKRVRAAWRLIEPRKKKAAARCRTLAAAARMVSGDRDAAVLRDLIADIAREADHPSGDGFYHWLTEAVAAHCHDRSTPIDRGDGYSIQVRLAIALEDLELYHRDRHNGRRVLVAGMKKTAKKCRASLMRAAKSDTPDDWHRARRRVKFVVHQNQVLCELDGSGLPEEVVTLRALAKKLGDWNDLDNLRAAISRIAVPTCHADDLREVMAWVDQRDVEIREEVAASLQK